MRPLIETMNKLGRASFTQAYHEFNRDIHFYDLTCTYVYRARFLLLKQLSLRLRPLTAFFSRIA